MEENKMLTVQELADKIRDWEQDAGESFTDYFMHDRVADNSWAFWLLGKGYTERANIIIDQILKGEICLDQGLLYLVNSGIVEDLNSTMPYANEVSPWNSELYDKDVLLWAEFLLATPFYTEKVTNWLKYQE